MLRNMGALALCGFLLTGCFTDPHKQKQIQEENEKARDLNIRTVGDVSDFGNGGPLQVHGVGLVTGLAGTGHCPDNEYRTLLEGYLLKNTGPRGGHLPNVAPETSVRRILDNPNNCLVIVSGQIPAGARKGDRFDVDIKLPEGSKASSLAGGYLHLSILRVYEAVANITNNPNRSMDGRLLPGHIFGDAKGPLVVAFGDDVDPHEFKRAKVWLGGASRIARPYHLSLRKDEKSLSVANNVARRINFMYQDDPKAGKLHADYTDRESQILLEGAIANQLNQRNDPSGMSDREMARAVSAEIVNVRVPQAYRYNHDRFLSVSSLTPIDNNDPGIVRYRKRLEKLLLDPRDTLAAAMRLEALGRDSIPLLKAGLNSDHPFVRFASAEALAYLGSPAGAEALGQLAQQHPVFIKHATTALANLGETTCRDKLAELMLCDDPAVRCAAFYALSLLLDELEQEVQQRKRLHRFPQASGSMIYFAVSKRPQVVIFGRGPVLAPGTRMLVGKDYTLAPGPNAGEFLVKRITPQGEQKRISTNRLDDILVSLTELRAAYPDIVDFLTKANQQKLVNSPISTWSTPDVTLQTLLDTGRQMPPTPRRAVGGI
ncbi:MAG: flagellar basal body P-ring protein FlgI [Planctomycetes bacterium]|nr:flagellar basal body P-ring protein FlgI [Planctomycetota bacterium]